MFSVTHLQAATAALIRSVKSLLLTAYGQTCCTDTNDEKAQKQAHTNPPNHSVIEICVAIMQLYAASVELQTLLIATLMYLCHHYICSKHFIALIIVIQMQPKKPNVLKKHSARKKFRFFHNIII